MMGLRVLGLQVTERHSESQEANSKKAKMNTLAVAMKEAKQKITFSGLIKTTENEEILYAPIATARCT